jgi:hypothetical protein
LNDGGEEAVHPKPTTPTLGRASCAVRWLAAVTVICSALALPAFAPLGIAAAHAGLGARLSTPNLDVLKKVAECGADECVGSDGKCYPYRGGGTDACGPVADTPNAPACAEGECMASDGKCYPYHGGGTDACGPPQPAHDLGIKKKPREGVILGQ